MNFIIRKPRTGDGRDDWNNPRIRKLASDAYDEAQGLSLPDAAKVRRKHLKELRFARLAKEHGLERGAEEELERIASMRAIRRNMERRIND